MAKWRSLGGWRLKRTTILLAAGLAVLGHQTFIASEAQPQLIFAALVLMGLPIPLHKDEIRESAKPKPKEEEL